MKKIITFLLTVFCVSSVFAQTGRDYQDNQGQYGRQGRNSQDGNYSNDSKIGVNERNGQYNDYAYNGRHNNNFPNNRERIYQIERINRDYDHRMEAIMRNRFMHPSQKNRMIRNLEMERAARIREINARYNGGRFDDDRYHRGNNYHH